MGEMVLQIPWPDLGVLMNVVTVEDGRAPTVAEFDGSKDQNWRVSQQLFWRLQLLTSLETAGQDTGSKATMKW